MTTFTLYLDVTDPTALIAAAKAHPDVSHNPDAIQDESDALRVLLDPGLLDGCEVHDSEVDFEGEN